MTFEELKKELSLLLSNRKDYIIEYNLPMLSEKWKKNDADLAIINRKDPTHQNFAVLVSTSKSEKCKIDSTYAKKIVKRMVEEYDFWVGLVWDTGTLWEFDPTRKGTEWQKISVHDIVCILNTFIESHVSDNFIENTIESLQKLKITQYEKKIIEPLSTWLQELDKRYLFQQNRTISVHIVEQFKLLTLILKNYNIRKTYNFCRYTSITSLKRILLEQHESMCGLAGMNDKSEGFFLDKCLTGNSFNLSTKPQYVVDQYNEIFILSLCDVAKSDDLTMWRLYGSDCKGVCLHYDVNLEEIRKSQEFFLMPVCYGDADNPLVTLFKILNRLPYILGCKFGLTHKYIWRYFVKPKDFEVEEEYRLLYLPNDKSKSTLKWIYNDGYGIFHPLREFDSPLTKKSSQFPLQLKKVILGPKCSEAPINKVQLKSYIGNSPNFKSSTLDIIFSKIDFYR